MRPARSRTIGLLLFAAASAASAQSQQGVTSGGNESTRATRSATGNGIEHRGLDPGFEDVGPLGQSLRLQPIDIRRATDFSRVYGVNDGSGRFVRRSGAIRAVFPQSDYAQFRQRRGPAVTVPLTPAGTIYYIGDPVDVESAQDPRVDPSGARASGGTADRASLNTARLNRISSRIRLRATAPDLARDPARPAPKGDGAHEPEGLRQDRPSRRIAAPRPPRRLDVMTNERYRRTRIKEMTRRVVLELIEDGRTIDRIDPEDAETPGVEPEENPGAALEG